MCKPNVRLRFHKNYDEDFDEFYLELEGLTWNSSYVEHSAVVMLFLF